MPVRERECGELPSPNSSLSGRKAGQGPFVSPVCSVRPTFVIESDPPLDNDIRHMSSEPSSNPPDFSNPTARPVRKSGDAAVIVFALLFSLPFAGLGVAAVIGGLRKLAQGDTKNGLPVTAIGMLFALIGFGFGAAVLIGRRKAKQAATQQQLHPNQPWLARPEWSGPRIKPLVTTPSWIYLLMGAMFVAIPSPALISLPKELHRGNYPVLIVLLFPAVALFLFSQVFRQWRAHRRFGDCWLEPAKSPLPLGGVLEGVVETGHRFQPEHGLHLKLTCLSQVTTGSGKNRSVHVTVLWQDEKVLRPEAGLTNATPDHSRIPVCFQIPADQPATSATSGGSDGVHWRLEVRTHLSGPDLNLTFELPVYPVQGFVADAAQPAKPEADLMAAQEMPVEELRRESGSRIRVTDGPGGREFYFPAARNPGLAASASGGAVAFLGLPLLIFKVAHDRSAFFAIFGLIFGGVGVLLVLGAFNAWLRSSRVTIDSTGVRRTYGWLWIFRLTRTVAASDVNRFETKAGTTSGNQTYWSLQVVTNTTKSITLADGLAEKPEADWLAREMNRALGR